MTDIRKAEISDFNEIVSVFKQHKKLFPHIRLDYITKMLIDGKCIFEDGVVIMFNQYKRNNTIGTVTALKGTYTIKQIVNMNPGNGASERILNKFVEFAGTDVYLSVRADNKRAIQFYNRTKFVEVGSVNWKQGTIPGCVFVRKV